GRAGFPHPGLDRTQAQCQWAAGSSRVRLLIGNRRCLIPRLGPFPASPVVIPDGGISPVRLGTVAFPLEPAHGDRQLKRWPASLGDHRVCSRARHARLQRIPPASGCRLLRASCPPLPRAPLLRRHYPPSSLLWAHARVLWPPCHFDLSLVGIGLRRLGHPRLVHRTVLALTACPLLEVSC